MAMTEEPTCLAPQGADAPAPQQLEPEWTRIAEAGTVVDSLTGALRRGESGIRYVPGLMRRVLLEGSWRERRISTGEVVTHDRFVDFLTAPPLEGLGEDPEMVKRLLRDDPEVLAAFEAAIVGKHGGDHGNQHTGGKSSNPTLATDRGKAYTLRRLARDHPLLFERVKAGELSANAAAIEAGFRKVPTALQMLEKAWRRASVDERRMFLRRHGCPLDQCAGASDA